MKSTTQSGAMLEDRAHPNRASVETIRQYYISRSDCVWSSWKILGLLLGGLIASILLPAGVQASEPDVNAPWPEAEKQGLWPKGGKDPRPAVPVTPAASGIEPPVAATTDLLAIGGMPQFERPRKHEVSFSADYFLGQGEVTLPVGFSLAKSFKPLPSGLGFPLVSQAERESDYFGATLSYSFGQSWYLDLSYLQGESSGSADIDFGDPLGDLPTDFTIDDTWYQAYVRYSPIWLRQSRWSVYVRAGASYVQAELNDKTVFPGIGLYSQQNDTTDILGNLGFGFEFLIAAPGAARVSFQVDGEGFYGTRSQESLEKLPEDLGLTLETAKFDNTLYGGIGRATLRFQYALGRKRLLRVFVDGGAQAKFTWIEYPSESGFRKDTFEELLWGPYVKMGLRYSF